MKTLSDHEKRTIRMAVAVLIIFFAAVGAARGWKVLAARRTEYNKLLGEAKNLRQELAPYQSRAQTAGKLMEAFKMDPLKLNRATVVGETSAAIQKAAMSGGIQLGPIRESPARTAAKELASIQLDGVGQVQAVMTFLSQFDSLGYPLIVDSMQLTSDPQKPGMVKVHLTIVIMDFEQWKHEDRSNA